MKETRQMRRPPTTNHSLETKEEVSEAQLLSSEL